jgi:hypothetical protein
MGEQSAKRLTPVSMLAIALVACGADARVDLGHNDQPGVVGASLTDYAGSWEGYAEAFKWSDDSDMVRLRLDESGIGAIEVGDVAAPALVIGGGGPMEFTKPVYGMLMPGFDYSVADAAVTSRRIRLSTSSQQPYSRWCSAFEPVADPMSAVRFSCLLSVGWSFKDGDGCRLNDAQRTPFDCAKADCDKYCMCDVDRCYAMTTPGDVQIDAALANEGEELAGTLLMGSERVFVRMQRTP